MKNKFIALTLCAAVLITPIVNAGEHDNHEQKNSTARRIGFFLLHSASFLGGLVVQHFFGAAISKESLFSEIYQNEKNGIILAAPAASWGIIAPGRKRSGNLHKDFSKRPLTETHSTCSINNCSARQMLFRVVAVGTPSKDYRKTAPVGPPSPKWGPREHRGL